MYCKIILNYLLFVIIIFKVFAVISVIDKGILPLEKNSVAIMFFLEIENENHIGTCEVYTKIQKCCLTDLDKEDCDVVNVFGETGDVIKSKDRTTFLYIYPTLCQYDLVGYCDMVVNYHCSKIQDRYHINIPFDTRVYQSRRACPLLKSYLSSISREPCQTLDQNALDNCFPIDCDRKYAGQRIFYDEGIKRCIKAPVCVEDSEKELPNIVYVPTINACKDLQLPLTIQDIYAITTGLGTVAQSTKQEDDVKVELKSNCTTISQNLRLLKDLMYGKLCPCEKNANINFESDCKSAVLSIVFCVIRICAVFLSFLFCVNTTVWVHRQWSNGNINAFVVRVKSKFRRTEQKRHRSRINSEIKNTLLREVIVKDIPLELRDSVVSICDRMEKEVKKKRRYRYDVIGSQISLQRGNAGYASTSSSSSDTLCSEKEPFIK